MSRPSVSQASCRMKATSLSPDGSMGGVVTFTPKSNDSDSGVWVTFNVSGLVPGGHGFHVHTWGDVTSGDGNSVGGHFVGNCSVTEPCRPSGLQEVGNLFDGAGLVASVAGVSEGMRLDGVIRLDGGVDSIVGRSLIIHGDGVSSGTRVGEVRMLCGCFWGG